MTLNLLLLALVFVVACIALYDFRRRPARQPRLIYTILPPYEVPELIVASGVLVENRGNAPARSVKIAVAFSDSATQKIRNLQITSDVTYHLQGGGERESYVSLDVEQIDPGQKLVIYFSGADRAAPQVTVSQATK